MFIQARKSHSGALFIAALLTWLTLSWGAESQKATPTGGNNTFDFIDGAFINTDPLSQVGLGCDCQDKPFTTYRYCKSTAVEDTTAVDAPAYSSISTTVSLESDGGQFYCGQFANGDYWVSPKDTESLQLTGISADNGEPKIDINPTIESQGFMKVCDEDEGQPVDCVTYDPLQDVVLQGFPVAVSEGDMIVVNSNRVGGCENTSTGFRCTNLYIPITVLDAPLENSRTFIRPPIMQPAIGIETLDNYTLSRVPVDNSLAPASQAAIDLGSHRMIRGSNSFTFHIKAGGSLVAEGMRNFRPDGVFEEYGADYALQWNALLTLLFSPTAADKVEMTSAVITEGRDQWFALYETTTNPTQVRSCLSGAGQHPGHINPMGLFAALHNNTIYSTTLATMGADYRATGNTDTCQELRQVQQSVYGTDYPVWEPAKVVTDAYVSLDTYLTQVRRSKCQANLGPIADGTTNFGWCDSWYPSRIIGPENANVGRTSSRSTGDFFGYLDGPNAQPGTSYFDVTAGPIGTTAYIAMLMPEFEAAINYNEIIEFSARVRQRGIETGTQPGLEDQCALMDPRDFCDVFTVNLPAYEMRPDTNTFIGELYQLTVTDNVGTDHVITYNTIAGDESSETIITAIASQIDAIPGMSSRFVDTLEIWDAQGDMLLIYSDTGTYAVKDTTNWRQITHASTATMTPEPATAIGQVYSVQLLFDGGSDVLADYTTVTASDSASTIIAGIISDYNTSTGNSKKQTLMEVSGDLVINSALGYFILGADKLSRMSAPVYTGSNMCTTKGITEADLPKTAFSGGDTAKCITSSYGNNNEGFCRHMGEGLWTDSIATQVGELTYGIEPNVDLSSEPFSLYGKCIKQGKKWVRQSNAWVEVDTQVGDVSHGNYGYTSRFETATTDATISRGVDEFEANWLNLYSTWSAQ